MFASVVGYFEKNISPFFHPEVSPSDKNLFIKACDEGDLAKVTAFAKKRMPLNFLNETTGTTPLHSAVKKGHVEVVRFLLQSGADKDIRDMEGATPLMVAIEERQNEIAKILVKQGADKEATDKSKNTALFYASIDENEEMLRFLLQQGAFVDAQNADQQTSLAYAIVLDKKNCARTLLEYGASGDVMIVESKIHRAPPLYFATVNKDFETVQLLLRKGAKVDAKESKFQMTSLHMAAIKNDIKTATILLNHGADVNAPNINLDTPLHFAATESREMVALLISKGASPNVRNKKGETPLHFAASRGFLEAAEELISRGALVEDPTQKKQLTPLHLSSLQGSLECVLLLLKHGASVNMQTKTGETPLLIAASSSKLKVMRLLVENGAEVNKANVELYTPLHFAAQEGKRKMAAFLISRGAQLNARNKFGNTPLHNAAFKGRVNVVEELVRNGALIEDPKRKNQFTPLHAAVSQGHLPVILFLFKRHANVNMQTKTGGTPLFLAASRGYIEVMAALIEKGADVNKPTTNLRTALYAAAEKGHTKAVELLLKHGAEVDVEEKNHSTPLDAAIRGGHQAIVSLLLDHGAVVSESSLDLARKNGFRNIENTLRSRLCNSTGNLETKETYPLGDTALAEFEKAKTLIHEKNYSYARDYLKMAIESQRKITSRFHPSLIPLYHQLELCYWAYGLGLEDLPMIDLLESEENHSTGNSRANIQLYLAYHLGLKSRRLERKDFAEKSAEYARKAGKTVQLQRMTSLDDATFYGNLGIVYYNLLDMEKAISNLQLALTTFRFELGRSHPAIQKYQTILDIAAEMKVHKEKNYKLKIKKRLAIVSDLSDGFGFEAFKVIARKKKNSEKTVQGVQWSGQRVQWTATTKSLSKYNPDNPHNPHFHSSNKTTSRYRLV